MEEMSLATLIAVFEEMFGRALFWALVVAAVAFVMWVTKSRVADVGGPIDWIVLLGVAVVGAGGFSILVYVAQSLIRGRRDEA